jgi:hypothetical protein
MIRFFKAPQPAALFIIPLLVTVLWLTAGFSPILSPEPTGMPLWTLAEVVFHRLPNFRNLILLIALVSFEAIYLNQITNRHEVIYRNSYLPSLAFALVAASSAGFLVFHPLHIVNLLLLRLYDKSFSLFKNESPTSALFDSAFLAALAALFYFPALPFFFLLLLAVNILRPFSFREMLVVLIGYVLPFFFISVYFFWNHGFAAFWNDFGERFYTLWPVLHISWTGSLIFLSVVMGVLLVLSVSKMRRHYSKNIIRARNYQQLLYLHVLFGIGSLLLMKEIREVHFLIFAIPVSVFYSYYFVAAKRRLWMVELLLWLLIIAVIWNHIHP